MTGWSEIRQAVLERDGWRCRLCHKPGFLEVHHLKQRKNGGSDEMVNLVTLCDYCHAMIDPGRRAHLPKHKRKQIVRTVSDDFARRALIMENRKLHPDQVRQTGQSPYLCG